MSPELERLIRLQDIETRAAEASRTVAEAPGRIAALDDKLTAARQAVADARQAVADNQAEKRTIDKDLLAAQQRLSKYKEQLMAVKTNEEYHAMQHQIAAATQEVSRIEEQALVNMLAADEVSARLKAAEAALKKAEAAIAAERTAIESEAAEMTALAARLAADRAALTAQMDRANVELFERIAKARHGLAVARAADERCTVCQVRLRPQVFNQIRHNETIHQCDSCQRVLYYVPVPAAAEPKSPPAGSAPSPS
ncbi:MAG: C4-type zinc ribbon domain-containing protein [Acidobacteriota bacterium]